VASGEGLTEAFYSIGATIVVTGGETMNPSVQELLQAVESAPSFNVIILPNNPNILLAAEQVTELSQKNVRVVPATTIPQGIAAVLVLNPEVDLETNAAEMNKALTSVRSGEVTTAVRSMDYDGLSIEEGQTIAFLDGDLVIADGEMPQAVLKLISMTGVEDGGLITIYYGANTHGSEAGKVAESVRKKYPAQEVEVVSGGQPHYNYIVSVE
jgi:dihydroxyacetone kinase-like predicted kinase